MTRFRNADSIVYPTGKVYWIGTPPTNCNICLRPIEDFFIDGVVRVGSLRNTWALVCPHCHAEFGFGFGKGVGQKYEARTTENEGTFFVKVTG